MQAHDDPELRARVKAELLYPTTPKREPVLTATQVAGITGLYWRGRTVAYLSEMLGIPAEIIRDAVGEATDAQAA